MQIKTNSHTETQELGEKIGELLEPGDIVLLFGELGSGKTTFTQGVSCGLGLSKEEYVRSPTFTLINEYTGRVPIYHIDLYRLESLAEIESLGLEEVLFGEGVSIIEWAEKLYPAKNKENPEEGFGIEARIEIRITILDETCRLFDIQAVNMPNRTF